VPDGAFELQMQTLHNGTEREAKRSRSLHGTGFNEISVMTPFFMDRANGSEPFTKSGCIEITVDLL
jgi:hypothetical protein